MCRQASLSVDTVRYPLGRRVGRISASARAAHAAAGNPVRTLANFCRSALRVTHRKATTSSNRFTPDPRRLSSADPRRREQLPMRTDAMQDHCTPTYPINEQEVRAKMTLRETAPLRTTLAEAVLAEG